MRKRIGNDQPLMAAQQSQAVEDSADRRCHGDPVDDTDVCRSHRLLADLQAGLVTDPLTLGKPDVHVEVVRASYIGTIDPRCGQPAQDAMSGDDQPRRRQPGLPRVLEVAVHPDALEYLPPGRAAQSAVAQPRYARLAERERPLAELSRYDGSTHGASLMDAD